MLKTLKTTGVALSTTFLITALPVQATEETAVAESYANIAHAVFEDSLITGKALQTTLDAFIAKPSDKTLA